jgi:hypothetical protein
MSGPHRPLARALSWLAVPALLLALPAVALAASNWGFGPGGQKTARITWETSQASSRNVFTLKVKVKSGKTPLGVKCKVSKHHPRQLRCPVSPATTYGYINVVAKKRIPCASTIKFKARIDGQDVKQDDIRSGNACS